jgi:hypothetical protein
MARNPYGYMARHKGRYPRRRTATMRSTCARCGERIHIRDEISYSPKLARWIHTRCTR